MDGISEEKGVLDGPGGLRLHRQIWRPAAPRAVLAVVHGLGEHIGRYAPHAAYFAARGFAVYGYDHPGHGRSGGVRGHTPSYDALLDGIAALLADARRREGAETPVVVWGHSMGGNIVLACVLRRRLDAAAVIATAPFLVLPKEPPAVQVALGRLLDRVAPSITLPTGLDARFISRDPAEVEAYRADPLVHGRISPRWFLGARAAAGEILARAGEFPLPLLLLHGGADGIVSVEGARRFAEAAGPGCRYREFPGAYHELHNDLTRDDAMAEMFAFASGYRAEEA